jgi:cell volume regulation protein A
VHHDAELILVAGSLLAAGVAASLVAVRIRIPALVLFLGLGLAIGTDGLGWIDFEDYALARLVGTIALVVILYEGGLSTGLAQMRSVAAAAVSLAIVATITTALIAGGAAALLFDFSVKEGLLLGAILSATDGAAVFALIRGSRMSARVAHTLEGEAGFNDPVAVLLVLLMIKLIQHANYGALDAVWFFAREIAVGTAVGLGLGLTAATWLRRARSAPPALFLVGSLATAAIAFGGATLLEGSGFLAVYLAGLTLGDVRLETRAALLAFHEGLASTAEIGLFFALGLLVFPSQLGDIAGNALLLALAVMLIARPVAVGAATVVGDVTRNERLLLSWAGLRGAVPVVLATFAVIEHVPRSLQFLNIVFFAVLVSAVIQGSTVELLARRLKLVQT